MATPSGVYTRCSPSGQQCNGFNARRKRLNNLTRHCFEQMVEVRIEAIKRDGGPCSVNDADGMEGRGA